MLGQVWVSNAQVGGISSGCETCLKQVLHRHGVVQEVNGGQDAGNGVDFGVIGGKFARRCWFPGSTKPGGGDIGRFVQ